MFSSTVLSKTKNRHTSDQVARQCYVSNKCCCVWCDMSVACTFCLMALSYDTTQEKKHSQGRECSCIYCRRYFHPQTTLSEIYNVVINLTETLISGGRSSNDNIIYHLQRLIFCEPALGAKIPFLFLALFLCGYHYLERNVCSTSGLVSCMMFETIQWLHRLNYI